MTEEAKALADSHSAEAVQAAATAQEAIEKARIAQMSNIIDEAITRFFESRSSNRFIDVNRIPFICDDLRGLHASFNELSNDLRWIKWLGGGFVAAAGLLAMKALGI